jgi:hypothetical protein
MMLSLTPLVALPWLFSYHGRKRVRSVSGAGFGASAPSPIAAEQRDSS